MVTNGYTVRVQQTSSGSYSTTTNATLTVGGVSDTFSVTTQAMPPITTPNPFHFTDQTNVALNATVTSNPITISGINAATSISITGGAYSINGGAFTDAGGTVTNGYTVRVQQTSSGSYSTTTNATLTVGGVSDTFSVITQEEPPITIPDPFHFTDQTNVALNTTVTSNPITISGINAATPISITGGTYSINGGAFTDAGGTVTNGNTVLVQQTSSGSYSTTTDATLTVGGVSDTFSVTTLTAPLYADYGSAGTWMYNGSIWAMLTPADPQGMAVTGALLYADYGESGTWKYDGSSSTWTKLTPADPQGMAASGALLYADYGESGTWKYDGSSSTWTKLTPADPQGMAASGLLLYADYGSAGTWMYNGSIWTKLSPADPQGIAVP